MRVNVQHAEEKLERFLKAIESQDTWRCLYAPLSRFFDNQNISLLIFGKAVASMAEHIEKQDGHLFLCHDGDILIFFEGDASNISDMFKERMSQDFGIATNEYRFFDMRHELSLIEGLCEEKLVSLKKIDTNKKKLVRDFKIDHDLVKTVETRRRKQRSTALIIEDDKMMRLTLQTILKNAHLDGHDLKIFQETNGYNGIQEYFLQAPDILFLDIEMPEHSGISVLKKIIELDPDAHVVMFSGHNSKKNIAQTNHIGAKGFITKPFNQEQVHHYINDCSSLITKLGQKQNLLVSHSLSPSTYR